MARREPSIPLSVLTNRMTLTLHQAVAAYLCDDPAGPQMTHAEAATALGLNARQEIATHLARAREEADDFGYLFWYIERANDPSGKRA